jgi:hypothetical protein
MKGQSGLHEVRLRAVRTDRNRGHCQLNGPRAPFCGAARLERGSTIGEQRTFRPEPPRHRHYEHTTGGEVDNATGGYELTSLEDASAAHHGFRDGT